MLKKDEERIILEQVAAIITPHLAHADTYGLHACYDLCIAWVKALDSDMPLECFQRSKDETRQAQEEAERRAKAIIDEANARAEAIRSDCELECRRMRSGLMVAVDSARKAFDALQKGIEPSR